jgi:hypothetical protein
VCVAYYCIIFLLWLNFALKGAQIFLYLENFKVRSIIRMFGVGDWYLLDEVKQSDK